MKLRTQFVLLVGGIIAVPFLVSAFVVLVHIAAARAQEPLPDYARIDSWVRRQVPRVKVPRDFERIMADKPEGLDIVVLDKDEKVSYSTIAALPPGPATDSAQVFKYMADSVGDYHFQIDAPRSGGEDESMVILKVPRFRQDAVFVRNQATGIIMYTSLALLVFSSLMSYLILRSLNRSILTLEGATRRIAEGNLDFELPAKGNDRISSLTRSFDSMRKALKEEYARRARFIMGVSHDLRTPLALIQGYVEAIADGYASEPSAQKRYLSIISDKTRALEAMIADLIEFVRMETGEWRMTHKSVEAKAFLVEIGKRFAEDALILKRDFRSSIDLPDGLSVRMDEALFARALENLIGNAIRYTGAGGKIDMNARLEAGDILLTVSDTGIGVPRAELDRIFDLFYRATNSRREQGFGLGLTTVKTIIESHGWSINVASEEGKWTVFTIRIPLAPTPSPS